MQARSLASSGQVPHYIPRLAQVLRDELAVKILTKTGTVYACGNQEITFPLMSVIKPFLLLFLLEKLGLEQIFSTVGNQPSELPFNSLEQLQLDGGFPRNPMINSGAIALASLLADLESRSHQNLFLQWLNSTAQCNLFLDDLMLGSVESTPNVRNLAIAELLDQSGCLKTSMAQALTTYHQICCFSGTVHDLALLGRILVESSHSRPHQIVKALMMTCGLYEKSAQFAVEIGLPCKSGVSGAVLAIVPGEGAIACYSPALDPTGNSLAGMFLLKQISQTLSLSIFN